MSGVTMMPFGGIHATLLIAQEGFLVLGQMRT
jgi:hypothetical protein